MNTVLSMTLTPATCRAARALLNISQGQLSSLCGVSKRAISNFEASQTQLIAANRTMIEGALEQAGVEFISANGGGPGVRLRGPAQST